jgi:hypothetical protein
MYAANIILDYRLNNPKVSKSLGIETNGEPDRNRQQQDTVNFTEQKDKRNSLKRQKKGDDSIMTIYQCLPALTNWGE